MRARLWLGAGLARVVHWPGHRPVRAACGPITRARDADRLADYYNIDKGAPVTNSVIHKLINVHIYKPHADNLQAYVMYNIK